MARSTNLCTLLLLNLDGTTAEAAMHRSSARAAGQARTPGITDLTDCFLRCDILDTELQGMLVRSRWLSTNEFARLVLGAPGGCAEALALRSPGCLLSSHAVSAPKEYLQTCLHRSILCVLNVLHMLCCEYKSCVLRQNSFTM